MADTCITTSVSGCLLCGAWVFPAVTCQIVALCCCTAGVSEVLFYRKSSRRYSRWNGHAILPPTGTSEHVKEPPCMARTHNMKRNRRRKMKKATVHMA